LGFVVKKESPLRILIADDHTLFREGLRGLLEEERDFRVVGEAPDGRAALEMVRALGPDVLLLDLSMPELDGIGVLRELSAAGGVTRVILLASSVERTQMHEVFHLGARGLLLKDTPIASLVKCIRSVAAGKYAALGEIRSDVKTIARRTAIQAGTAAGNRYGLTKRESEILVMIVAGNTNREIAKKSVISEQTVKHHLTHIFDKVGVYNRLELALFAIHHGIATQRPAQAQPPPMAVAGHAAKLSRTGETVA
jgi:DNA-binding NarL/FixJ family response regulator